MITSPAVEGALRSLGLVVLIAVLGWFANSANLSGWINPAVVTIITMIAGSIENSIKSGGGGALFGAVKTA